MDRSPTERKCAARLCAWRLFLARKGSIKRELPQRQQAGWEKRDALYHLRQELGSGMAGRRDNAALSVTGQDVIL